ncbi:GPP34 family phosphoprotein [Asanoa sp. WMMD1127]|uniref:GOLPH3/VPS74 family protein n=1 Tax=Asanoa sp. WMMD1127 TaxID=3016107 RepID=UPI0024168522|nr:GPP34 family phosphoprotein [Asanoa sp. WMMD1127]MDG4822249.1 GPP34 family phosphoprotein [Asanoa sp. WMMD1127]
MITLTLADELALLAHDDEGVNRMASPGFGYALGGALLIELALAGRVVVDDGRVRIADPTPTGAPLVDTALARIAGDQKRRKPKEWVTNLAKGLPERVLAGLVEAGLVSRTTDKVLWVFKTTRYPSPGGLEPSVETELRGRLDRAIRSTGPVEPRTAALLSLVRATNFERRTFPDVPKDQVEARLKEIDQADWAATAVKKAIEEMHAAIMVAVIVPATTAGSS